MKICPECHRISKDDDFCSYCGAAVFGADNYSESARCQDYSDHDHSKITYDRSERGTKIHESAPAQQKTADAFFQFMDDDQNGTKVGMKDMFFPQQSAQQKPVDAFRQLMSYDQNDTKPDEALKQMFFPQSPAQQNNTDIDIRKIIRGVVIVMIIIYILRFISAFL